MKNKTKMYGRLSAILLSTVLMMTALSTAAAEPPKNLITPNAPSSLFDPTFEAWTSATWSEDTTNKNDFYSLKRAELGTDGGHSGSNYIKMTEADDFIQIYVPVEPAKNYDFSFWMRNSLENALQLGKCAFVAAGYNNESRHEMANSSPTLSDWDWIRAGYNGYFGADAGAYGIYTGNNYAEYTFGATRKDNVWREVTINFSTLPAGVTHVKLVLKCTKADPNLALDDLSLVETGKKPNRIFNGDFEAIRNDKDTTGVSGVPYTMSNKVQTQVVKDDVTNNHYLKVNAVGDTQADWKIYSRTATLLQGKVEGTRYKLSFKAKAEDIEGKEATSTEKMTGIKLHEDSGGYYDIGGLSDEWKTYTMYIDGTNLAKGGISYFGPWTTFGRYVYPSYTLCVDDVYAGYDEPNIGFYKTLDIGAAFSTWLPTLTDYGKIFVNESGAEAESLEALTPDAEGNRTVKVRAHYLPEAKWGTEGEGASAVNTVSFDKTTVTLLAAVYKYEWIESERKYNKTLVGVEIENGTTQNGETIDVVGEVSVPAEKDGVTYQVEAMAWDMSNMKPIIDADKEQRTLK